MPKITVEKAAMKRKALNLFLEEEKDTIVNNAIQYNREKCLSMGIDIEKQGSRKLKKNRRRSITA